MSTRLRSLPSVLGVLALAGVLVLASAEPAGAGAGGSAGTGVAVSPQPGADRTRAASPALWGWPVANPHPIIRPFEAPATRYAAGHRGLDIGTSAGAPVLAPVDGVVHFAGVVVDRPVLSISHDGGLITSYEPVSSPLAEGDVVHRGEKIGVVAQGHCASTCLHFGVRLHGEYVSPLIYLGGLRPPVLLPTRRLPAPRSGHARGWAVR